MIRLALLLTLVLATSAQALPGDPPLTSNSPDDGASFQISDTGVTVGVGCPTYRDSDFGYPYTSYGYADSYRVRASTKADVGGDGLLADSAEEDYPQLDGEQSDSSTCHATFKQLRTPGTYYWQPYRACTGCDAGKEVGPVRSFTLVPDPDSVKLIVAPPARAYAGFGTLVPIKVTGTENRPAITLERRAKGRWMTIPSLNALNFSNDHIATFPAGHYAVRARLSLPQSGTVTSPEKTITVKRSHRGTPKSDGVYKDGRYDISASVTKGGRLLKKFKANVTGTCPIPAPSGGVNLNPMPISVAMPTVKIAPDGRFAAALPNDGYKIHLSGRLHAKRLTGTVVADTGGCSGTVAAFSASR